MQASKKLASQNQEVRSMTDQKLYDLVQDYYTACRNKDQQTEDRLCAYLSQFFNQYNVDTVGDLEDKLIARMR
jgi:hypothetical protein